MPDVVRCLLQAGADVTAPREGGCGALYIAIIGDDVEAVKLLLAEGADPNLGTTFHSLLSVARTRGNPSIIDLLSKAGARE
jgi:ankyrin repeat protein